MWKAKASHPQVAGRQVASRIKERRCSLRAESSLSRDTKGHASRPPLLPRDSVKLLRQRQMAKEDRPAQAEPWETAASPFHCECSLPEEPSTGDELHELVTAEARSSTGQAISVQYALTLTAREGRWEVRSMEPAPRQAADQPAVTTAPTPTSSAPAPSTAATTSPGNQPTR